MILDPLLTIFPYMAVSIFVIGTVSAFIYRKYKITTRASGFLENKALFWGSVPWHYGIIMVLTGHLLGVIAPSYVLKVTSNYHSLFMIESIAFAGGLLTLVGIIILLVRRFTNSKVFAGTGFFDILVLVLLLFQASSGLHIAHMSQWGINWFASNISVYFASLVKFAPNIHAVAELPIIVKLHALNFFLMLALLPFTRLVHILTVPAAYIFRKPIIIRWNR